MSGSMRGACDGCSHSSRSPGGIGSHVTPEVPGSLHEGGELGYALAHAYGAAFDDPELVVFCAVGDGEAETGPLADELALQPVHGPGARRRGAAHPPSQRLQDSNPTVLARIPRRELEALFDGYGYRPLFVEGDDPATHAPTAWRQRWT